MEATQDRHLRRSLQEGCVLGILNISPDSFSGDGISNSEVMKERVVEMIASGVGAIDVGAQSTRPGAKQIREEDELRMIGEAIDCIRAISRDVLVSVDTTRASVASLASARGADIINDISGGAFDPAMHRVISENPHLSYIFGHVRGDFASMHAKNSYEDIMEELIRYATHMILRLGEWGIGADRLLFDPCIGFSKAKEENLIILRDIRRLVSLPVPIVVGLSRKRFIRHLTGDEARDALDAYTLSLNTHVLLQGVGVIRTHEVSRTMKMMRIINHLTSPS